MNGARNYWWGYILILSNGDLSQGLEKTENRYFTDIKQNFGFGCMRLPMLGGEVDQPQMCAMVDTFMENGFNYFDTAHGYLGGKSETALRESLTRRYSRDKYILTDKLTNFFFRKQEDIRPFFEQQLAACGVDYFDSKKVFNNWNTDYYYNNVYTTRNGKASDCIKCGKCEHACPQHLSIRGRF